MDRVIDKTVIMKIINFITNPWTIIISFLMIIINGQHIGGFYFLYILLALPHAGDYAILAGLGIFLLLIGYYNQRIKNVTIQPIIYLIGVLLLHGSIFIFFYNDHEHTNYGTFYKLVPQITLILFASISISFIVKSTLTIYKIITNP